MLRPRSGAVLALAVATSLSACRRDPPVSEGALAAFGIDPAPGGAAPRFELAALDGSRVSLSSLEGQVVFVNFWATWCPPCRDEMPAMMALGRELAARHPGRFRMVAVSVDEGWDPVRDFFGQPPYLGKTDGLTVALDPQQATTAAYYCAARGGGCPDDRKFPESYIVDTRGRLVAYVVGPRDWSQPTAKAYLEGLLE
jgi:thiol-disulfide isomerase/thioredoxin